MSLKIKPNNKLIHHLEDEDKEMRKIEKLMRKDTHFKNELTKLNKLIEHLPVKKSILHKFKKNKKTKKKNKKKKN